MSQLEPKPIEEKEMCNLSEMTPAQLNAMTKAQIIAAALDGVERSVPSQIEYDEQGRPARHIQAVTDAYGVAKRSTELLFSYYGPEKDAPVDIITHIDRDAQGKQTGGHRLKHHTDGRQPEMLPLE